MKTKQVLPNLTLILVVLLLSTALGVVVIWSGMLYTINKVAFSQMVYHWLYNVNISDAVYASIVLTYVAVLIKIIEKD